MSACGYKFYLLVLKLMSHLFATLYEHRHMHIESNTQRLNLCPHAGM